MNIKMYLFGLVFFLLASCANVSLQQDLNYQGNVALERGDFELSRAKFEQALEAATSNQDKQYEAIAMFGLGRSFGYLCNYKESEKWFLKSIAEREALPDFDYAYITQNLLELARLYKASGEYSKANSLYERALPLLEKDKVQESDPIGYADMLEDYVITLKAEGLEGKASEITNTIQNLRKAYPDTRAYFIAKQYPNSCK